MSDEYPEYVNTNYNDAFLAQLNTWNVHRRPGHPDRQRTGQLRRWRRRRDLGRRRWSRAPWSTPPPLGITYDGATPLLTARTPVTPGSVNTLYLTIFDQGDGILDSAAFIDNLHYEDIVPRSASRCLSTRSTAQPASPWWQASRRSCREPAKLIVPVECNLPPGPISCTVTPLRSSRRQPGPHHRAAGAGCLAGEHPLAKGAADDPTEHRRQGQHEDDQGRHQLRSRPRSRSPRSCGPRPSSC